MKAALGRGLNTLLPSNAEEIVKIELDKIKPNKNQPRKIFNEDKLKELAESIKSKGVIQPIIVSRNTDGTYNLIAGERRWRAAKIAGLKEIPSLIKDYSSQDSIEIALIENIQREELNPLETAEAFDRLIKDFKITQEELSQRVGKERATITNYLRVLKLPDEVKRFINAEQISIGQAKALLILEDKKTQIEVAKEIVNKGLSVRATEQLCNRLKDPNKANKKTPPQKSLEAIEIEDKLTRALGTKVKLHHKKKRGTIEIEYYSLDELDRLLALMLR